MTCMATSGTVSLIFIDGGDLDSSTTMNSEGYRNILSANLLRTASNLIGRNFMQQDNNRKLTANTIKDFIRGKKCKVLAWTNQVNNPIEQHFTSRRED